ncbi:MAG: hypothetical protein U0K68_11920 [Agathobacter sp.]|nr:hypothetical protein [Agathobacter sp.]
MAKMNKDLILDDAKFAQASKDMTALKTRTNTLKTTLGSLYDDLTSALDTPAGDAVDLAAKKALLKPVEDMALVVGHISSTLDLVIGGGYYKDVFDGFDDIKNKL